MPERLETDLALDISEALRATETLTREIDQELAGSAAAFGDAYKDVVSSLPTISPDVDASGVGSAIEGSIADADRTAFVDGNADAVTERIDGAISDAQLTLPLDADTAQIEAALAGLQAEQLSLTLDVDVGDSTAQADALAESLSEVQDEGAGAGDGLSKVSNVSTTMATAFSAAKGDGSKLVQQLGQLGAGLGPVAAGAAGVAVGFVAMFQAGEKSIAAFERVKIVLGNAAAQIETIDVGGLTGSLSDLALQAGQSGSGLRLAAAQMAQVGLSAGASKPEVVDFANSVNALALRATAMNPALGDAGAVAERLSLVLGRGGRFLNRYGIDLSATEITARALADTGKATASELTSFERSVAGASIAVEKLGKNMGTDFEKGTEQTTVQLARLKKEFSSAFAKAGEPLVGPTIDAMKSLAQVGVELSAILGQLGTASIPVLKVVFTAAAALAIPLGLIADAMNAIPAPVLTAVVAMLAVHAVVGPLGRVLNSAGDSAVGFAQRLFGTGPPLAATGKQVNLLRDGLQTTESKLASFAAGAALAVPSFLAIGKSAESTALGVAGLTASGAMMGAAFGPQAAAAGAAAGAMVGLGQALFGAGESADGTRSRIQGLSTELSGLGNKATALSFLKESLNSMDAITDPFPRILTDLRSLAEVDPDAATRVFTAIESGATGIELTEKQMAKLKVEVDSGRNAYQNTAKAIAEQAAANKLLRDEAVLGTGATVAQTAALQNEKDVATLLTGAYQDQLNIYSSLTNAKLAQTNTTFAAIHADEQARDAILALDAANYNVTTSEDEKTRAFVAAQEATIRAADAAGKKAEADYTGGDAAEAHRLNVEAQKAELFRLMGPLEALPPIVGDYAGSLDAIPRAVDTQVRLDAAQAYNEMNELERRFVRIHQWDNVPITVRAQIFQEIYGQGAAEGGKLPPGWSGWVGEEGPELVKFPMGATVLDHDSSMQAVGAASGAAPTPPSYAGVPSMTSMTDAFRAALAGADFGGGAGINIEQANFGGDGLATLDYFWRTRLSGV